jgi:energy-coupling factor transport system permease protein
MALFEYEYRNTPIHRLHPLAKVAILVVFSVLCSYYQDPRFKLPFLLLIIVLCALARLPFRQYALLVLFVIFSVMMAYSYQIFFVVNPEMFRVYDPAWAGTTIFELLPAGTPVLGRAALTYGGLVWWTSLPLTAAIVVLTVSLYVYTTPLSDTLQMLSDLRAPFPIIYVASVAIRFVPELVQKLSTVQTAQKLRGWSGRSWNPVRLVRLYFPILVPTVRHIIKATDTMSLSATNRGFGLHRVKSMHHLTLKSVDITIISLLLAFFIFSIVVIFRFHWGNM